MRQLIALAIVAALGVGGWMYRDQIKALIVSRAEDGKTEDPKDPKTPSPNPTTPGTSGAGTTTPGTTTPGTTTPGTTTPGTTLPGTTTPGTTTPGLPGVPTLPGTTTSSTPLKVEGPVTLDLRAVPDEKGEKLDLVGTTNLLPGTELDIAITPRNGPAVMHKTRVETGSPKNTFKSVEHPFPDAQYQIDVIMYVNRQTRLDLSTAYTQPQMLKGPLVFTTPEGIIVRAMGVLRKAAKPKSPINIQLKAGTAK